MYFSPDYATHASGGISHLALSPPLLLSLGVPLPESRALGFQLSGHPLPLLGEEELRGFDALADGNLAAAAAAAAAAAGGARSGEGKRHRG